MSDEKKNKWISIMIVPEEGARVKKWRVTTSRFFKLKILFCIACFFVVIGFFSTASLGFMYAKMRYYQHFNDRLLEATAKLNAISLRLERYKENETKLRTILGSDIELPKPPAVEPGTGTAAGALSPGKRGGNELEQAIAAKESSLRRKPSIWPVNNPWQVTKTFKYAGRKDSHLGTDIVARMKSSVVATADGKVIFAGMDDLLGLTVTIDHENGLETHYGHNESLLVKYGDTVRKGQSIAVYGGMDGKSSTGVHLHYAVYLKGQPVDPFGYLPENPAIKYAKNDIK
ncbi:MAG: M23 family metallopeptidase [Candidatus Latescibacter sp.]|nr:M23 family metallopeptidase [Candidatus Latescibacter sp.]